MIALLYCAIVSLVGLLSPLGLLLGPPFTLFIFYLLGLAASWRETAVYFLLAAIAASVLFVFDVRHSVGPRFWD